MTMHKVTEVTLEQLVRENHWLVSEEEHEMGCERGVNLLKVFLHLHCGNFIVGEVKLPKSITEENWTGKPMGIWVERARRQAYENLAMCRGFYEAQAKYERGLIENLGHAKLLWIKN